MSEKDVYVVVQPKCDSVFHSSSARGAAGKAYSRCLRDNLKKSDRKKAHVVKVMRKGDGKLFSYNVKEIKDPRDVMRDGVLIHYEYRTQIDSLNVTRSPSKKRNGKNKSKSRSMSRRSKSKSRSMRKRSKSRSRSRK